MPETRKHEQDTQDAAAPIAAAATAETIEAPPDVDLGAAVVAAPAPPTAEDRRQGRVRGGVSAVPGPPAPMPAPAVEREETEAAGEFAPAANTAPNFKYHGGPVIVCPQIFVSFWGASWNDAAHTARRQRINQYHIDLLNSNFMNLLSQYGTGLGARNAGAYVRSNVLTNVPANLTDTQIHQLIQDCINAGVLPEPAPSANNLLMIYLDENVAVQDNNIGITMCEPQGDDAFGYHDFFTTANGHPFYYAVIPALTNACLQNSCPNGDNTCSLKLTETQEQRITQVASHEFAEMVTDPQLNAWTDNTPGGVGENGDICNGQTDTITVGQNTWNVQRIYSRFDDLANTGRCTAHPAFPEPPVANGPAVGHALIHKYWNGHQWGGPESLGGIITCPPTVAAWGPNRLDAFATGTDQALWHRYWDGAAWRGWESLGGILISDPKVVSWGANRLDVFGEGTDRALWHRAWNGAAWSGWESLGGILISEPSVVSWGANRIDIFVIGTDQAMWHRWWDGAAWHGWESLGGQLNSTPVAVSWGANRLDIFAVGMDRALWHRYWNGAQWGGWESLGGVLASPPAVASWGPNRLDIFVEGTDQAMWHRYWDGAQWRGWESLGGIINSTPGVVSWSANRLDVFALGTDRGLWHRWWDGHQWGGWEGLGGTLTSLPVPVAWAPNRLDIFATG